MKKTSLLSLLLLLCVSVDADAQIVRRPFFQRTILQEVFSHSINLPLGTFFPGAPNVTIPPILGGTTQTRIQVSQSVVDNISRIDKNLRDTASITDPLLKKYNLAPTSLSSSSSSAAVGSHVLNLTPEQVDEIKRRVLANRE